MGRFKADRAEPLRHSFASAAMRIEEVPRAILLRWPDVTIDELWQGMRLAASRPQLAGSHRFSTRKATLGLIREMLLRKAADLGRQIGTA